MLRARNLGATSPLKQPHYPCQRYRKWPAQAASIQYTRGEQLTTLKGLLK